ncbi:MAG: DNA ligase D, partial [Lysinibacillus sp.]
EVPVSSGWIYETKYDGYRCLLIWEKDNASPVLQSRNGNTLNEMFPEVVHFCKGLYEQIADELPLVLDGELVYLTNNYASRFAVVQKRGRMRKKQSIATHLTAFPCHYVAFDLIERKGKTLGNSRLSTRKQQLQELFKRLELPLVQYRNPKRLQLMEMFEDEDLLWAKVKNCNGEGIIAKKSTSKWLAGTRTKNWLKVKNWKYVDVIVMKLDRANQFFIGSVYDGDALVEIVTFKHGLSEEELQVLTTLFVTNGTAISTNIYSLPPSICVSIACIDFAGDKLREPMFHAFQHHLEPSQCNWEQLQRQVQPIPETVSVTHSDKPVYPAVDVTKDDYLLYLQTVAPFMLPFLKNRLLTVIRYPHGVPGESFYQKHRPDKLPSFVETHVEEDIEYILCNNLETLLWLGNQLAIEFHIPFQPYNTERPTEIVFDLDPPSVADFQLAVDAALKMKVIFDQFGLESFVKTSGGKGLQVYIPLPVDQFTYEQTGTFTEFVCKFLEAQFPDYFTTERMKKKRGNRLYLDYVQHRTGKTIIAPYSLRGNELGCVATPLKWEEVGATLSPDLFTITSFVKRIEQVGDLFLHVREVGQRQKFSEALKKLEQ